MDFLILHSRFIIEHLTDLEKMCDVCKHQLEINTTWPFPSITVLFDLIVLLKMIDNRWRKIRKSFNKNSQMTMSLRDVLVLAHLQLELSIFSQDIHLARLPS